MAPLGIRPFMSVKTVSVAPLIDLRAFRTPGFRTTAQGCAIFALERPRSAA